MANHIQIVSANVGALSNALRPIFKIPSGYGGIRVIGCNYTNPGTGTSWVQLVDLGSSGTAVSKIVADAGTVVSVAAVPQAVAVTAANAFVDEGHWIGVKEANIGAMNAVSIVDVAFIPGK
jgi:hypothetical protein